MVYGFSDSKANSVAEAVMKKLEGVDVTITYSRKTPGGFGDLSVRYNSTAESKWGRDSGNFNLCSAPNNCGLAFVGGMSLRIVRKKALKLEVLDLISKHMEHSGILMSQVYSGYKSDYHEMYEKYGFHCVVQDRGVVHGNNNDLRIYYKDLNSNKKKDRGGPSWEIPMGLLSLEDLRQYNDK